MERGARVAAARRRRHRNTVRGESVSTTGRAPALLEPLQAASCPYGLASGTHSGALQPGGCWMIRYRMRGEHDSFSYREGLMPPNAKALAAPLVACEAELASAHTPPTKPNCVRPTAIGYVKREAAEKPFSPARTSAVTQGRSSLAG